MTADQGPFPGSKSHRELCERDFNRLVLPHLRDNVKGVFRSHFADSYGLIRALSHEQGEYDVRFALAALGVRAFDVDWPRDAGFLRRNAQRLAALGIGCRTRPSGKIDVFNRALVGPVLAEILGTMPDSENSVDLGLEKFSGLDRRRYPYDLLIWSSFIPPGRYDGFIQLDFDAPFGVNYHAECRIPESMPELAEKFTVLVTEGITLMLQIRGLMPE